MMASKLYPLVSLEDLVSIHDAERIPVKQNERKAGVHPYYGASGITDYVDGYLFDGEYVLLSEDGDNLITQNTPIAFMATGKFWVNNHAHILKGRDGHDTRFICYALQIADVKSYISGSTRPKITQKDMRKILVYSPPKTIKREISTFIHAFDKKIELNRQMNATLEAMAQALFKSWFVDFDPVIDNALAAGNPIPDELEAKAAARQALGDARKPLPEDIRSLFPNAFVFTEEMGWIPEGWGIEKLSVLTIELKRGVSPKYIEDGGVQVVNQKCIRNHEVNFSLSRRHNNLLRKIDGQILEVGDLLINSTGTGTLGRMAQVQYLDETTIVDSHVTIVRSDPQKFPSYTFAQMMFEKEQLVEAMGEGSTGQTELSRKILLDIKVLLPSDKAMIYSEVSLKNISNKRASNIKQIKRLSQLRDTLLPKLLSGELRIPEADQLIKETLA
jgi:type I restriction enzyme S subunit